MDKIACIKQALETMEELKDNLNSLGIFSMNSNKFELVLNKTLQKDNFYKYFKVENNKTNENFQKVLINLSDTKVIEEVIVSDFNGNSGKGISFESLRQLIRLENCKIVLYSNVSIMNTEINKEDIKILKRTKLRLRLSYEERVFLKYNKDKEGYKTFYENIDRLIEDKLIYV